MSIISEFNKIADKVKVSKIARCLECNRTFSKHYPAQKFCFEDCMDLDFAVIESKMKAKGQ